MRTITIHQNNTQNIQILDETDEPIDQYCNKLTELMKMSNVVVLNTSTASVVLRPSKIVGIKVEETDVSQPPPIIQSKETKVKKQEIEDIITDVDN